MTTAESNLAQASSEEDSDETNTEAAVVLPIIQGSAKRSAYFVKQQPGRARQKG